MATTHDFPEAIAVNVGDQIRERVVVSRKVYRSRNESFRRVRLTFEDGTTETFRERFRVPRVSTT